jgi:hypothetical protein
MTRQTLTIAAIAFVCGTAAAVPIVTYESPCECRDYHGKGRLTEKNDAALPPSDPNTTQAVTPSDIFSWQGPTEPLKPSSRRIAAEQKWYAVTGRVVELQAEADGDLHIALQDATGDKPGIVVAEIPAKPHKRWCELREIVFSWTHPKFPFRVRSGRKLNITEPRIITVTGKAFFDFNHAPADQSNRRTELQGYAAWEIHPMMKIALND